jgi:hypothetical protein
MGIGDISSATLRAFAKDVLSIEICGPDRPQLTLVNLPGLVHSENQSQSRDDVFVLFLTYTIFEGKPLYPSVAFAAMWLLTN